jgi:hypothetical protein
MAGCIEGVKERNYGRLRRESDILIPSATVTHPLPSSVFRKACSGLIFSSGSSSTIAGSSK